MNQGIDPLEVDTLPTDPRIMALRLLGMTTAEMKDIDKNIVGSGSNISGLRLNVNKIVDEFNTALTPVVPVAAQQQVLQDIVQPQVHTTPATTSISSDQVTVNYDPNQLEFDFYKKITPEDLQLELKNINKNIKNLQEKIDLIYKELSTKKN